MNQTEQAQIFEKLHHSDGFIIPNPWDTGTAKMLAGVGFKALATSSAGLAFSLGKLDGELSREEVLEHCKTICNQVAIPVTADLENGFGESPKDTAETIRLAAETGLVGGSIEDATGDANKPIYDFAHAVERVTAAAEAASEQPFKFMFTARAENYLHGKHDLDDTILRLQAFEKAGADVLYAPGLPNLEAIAAICSEVNLPLNVLAVGALAKHSADELYAAGATRISLGSVLARNALGHLALASQEMLNSGTFSFSKVMGGRADIDDHMT